MFSTTNTFTNLYSILGVDKNSNYHQIKKAYNQKALQYYPDKNKASEAATQFLLVHNAYEILSNNDKRQEYDKKIAEFSENPHDKVFADTQPNKFYKINNILLHEAIKACNIDLVKELIANGADTNSKGENGYPLLLAAKNNSVNHLEILKILLRHNADPNLRYYNKTAMDGAGCAGNVAAFALLVPITQKRNIVTIDYKTRQYPWYTEIMFEAADSPSWIEILKILKKEGADLNQRSIYDVSILDIIIRKVPTTTSNIRKYFECENRYLDHTWIKQRDETYHSQLKFYRMLQLIDYALDEDLNPNNQSKRDGMTALHNLMEYKNLDYVINGYARTIDKCLLKGFNINIRDTIGRTLLHCAADNGNYEAIKYLLSRNADRTIRDKKGLSPEDYANLAYKELCISLETQKHLDNKSKYALLAPLQQITTLLSGAQTTFENKRFFSAFTQETRDYINLEIEFSKRNRTITLSLLASLSLEKQDRQLLEIFRDDVSFELIEIPVMLNERVYDFRTLITILKNDREDPFTGELFDISDIDRASEARTRMDFLIYFLSKKYSNMLSALSDSQINVYCVKRDFGSYIHKKLASEIQPRFNCSTYKNQYYRLFSDEKSKVIPPESEIEMLESINQCVFL